ncbi:MAG: zinc ribbon domain-containing protein [Planctomycetes bacterium]|nr:zinc ribbon domain-containing protein [Planctomycetota bacterium]
MRIVYIIVPFIMSITLPYSTLMSKEIKKEEQKAPQKKESVSNTQQNITKNKLCPECNRIYPGDISFCSVDGKQLIEYTEEVLICPTCKQKANPGEKFCKNDGTQLILQSSTDKKTSLPDKKTEINLPPDATQEEKMKAAMYHFMEGFRGIQRGRNVKSRTSNASFSYGRNLLEAGKSTGSLNPSRQM